jgi:hypothetical protein
MGIPLKEKVVSDLQNYTGVTFQKLPNKDVLYIGELQNGSHAFVYTPQSKLHAKGNGWIDVTKVQYSVLDKSEHSIIAFRLEDDKIYYFDFSELKKYLTDETLLNNKREGDHWKLYVWSDYIEVRGNGKRFPVVANDLTKINLQL